MVLDSGIASFFSTINSAEPGEEPNDELQQTYQSWYGELDFVSTPRRSAGAQLEITIDRKIRVVDGPGIIEGAIVKIDDDAYTVIQAWHGRDKESGEHVADIGLHLEVRQDG